MRVLAKVAAIALVGLAAACGDSGTEPTQIAGTYNLQTVNGAPPPAVIVDMVGYKLEVTAASYVLTSSGNFTSNATFRETEGGVATTSNESVTGKYTVAGSTITFTDADGEVLVGVLSGNKIQFSEDGVTAIFAK